MLGMMDRDSEARIHLEPTTDQREQQDVFCMLQCDIRVGITLWVGIQEFQCVCGRFDQASALFGGSHKGPRRHTIKQYP